MLGRQTDRTVHGQDRTVHGQDRTVYGQDKTVHGQDKTVCGQDRDSPQTRQGQSTDKTKTVYRQARDCLHVYIRQTTYR
jgi:hypothetical protein